MCGGVNDFLFVRSTFISDLGEIWYKEFARTAVENLRVVKIGTRKAVLTTARLYGEILYWERGERRGKFVFHVT